jgi:hypothetical protein
VHGEYDLVVLEVSRNEPEIDPWLSSLGLYRVETFAHSNGDAVIVARPSGRRSE